jgi:hypothetical protein
MVLSATLVRLLLGLAVVLDPAVRAVAQLANLGAGQRVEVGGLQLEVLQDGQPVRLC